MSQNGVIVYLSCKRDFGLLHHSLKYLCKNYLAKHPYPIVIFHDDLTPVDQSSLRVWLHQEVGFIPKISFEMLNFHIPDYISKDPARYDLPISNQFRLGYRHMCNFFAGEVYDHPAIAAYDWYLRIDSDSFILSEINFDFFDYMVNNELNYAYVNEYDKDSELTTVGFFDTTMQYFKNAGVDMSSLEKKLDNGRWDLQVFSGNFVLGKLSFFRSPEYRNYYNHLKDTGNFYYRRWGDHIVHWFAVNTYMKPEQIWRITEFAYQHGSWVQNIDKFNPDNLSSIPMPYQNWVRQHVEYLA